VDTDNRRACVQQHGEYGEVGGREVRAGDDAETACEIASQENERELLLAGGCTPTMGTGRKDERVRAAAGSWHVGRRGRDAAPEHDRMVGRSGEAAREPAQRGCVAGVGEDEPLESRGGRGLGQILARAEGEHARVGMLGRRGIGAVEHHHLVAVRDARGGDVGPPDRRAEIPAVAPDQYHRQPGQARGA
jgi:hypothetical protein